MEELKHGHWIAADKQQGTPETGYWTERYLKCSICDYERRHSWLRGEQPKYCENCGNIMDGDKNGK